MKIESALKDLECSYCSASFDPERLIRTCPKDGKPLLARYDLDAAAKTLRPEAMAQRVSSLWRYAEILPVRRSENVISLGEGWTPLLRPDSLQKNLGAPNLFLKDESVNPTGSFKARGMTCAVSRAKELGALELCAPSAGNAGGALAAYAAASGLRSHIFMPMDVPQANVVECKVYGAETTLVEGFITDAGKICKEQADIHGWFDVSTLREPYRVEGKKTMGWELVEQLGKVPDVIIYPTGGGTGLVGIWKAMEEMEQIGWIGSARPRMVSVQAEGCSPIVRAFRSGNRFAEPFDNPTTLAAGLRVPAAIGDFLILDAIRRSGGTAVTVSDEDMLAGVSELGSLTGVFAAPEGGAVFAALKVLLASKDIEKTETIVLMNTGSGLKYLDKTATSNL